MLAGLANSAWAALLAVAVVPLYLRYLGMEAYGLIGFFATTQAVLQILDLGLAPTINREVARCRAEGDTAGAGKLLHTLAFVYWATAALIAVASLAAGPTIARHWLQPRGLPEETVATAVTLIGVVVACRWPTSLYLGALMGVERLTVASWLGMVATTVANLGAVAVIALISPTLQAFFAWQALAGLAYALASRWAAWRILGRPGALRFDTGELRRVWRFSAGMSAIAALGLLSTQLDKLLLSRLLQLEDLGRYMLATMVAGALGIIINPLFNALFPRFSTLVATGETGRLESLYRASTRLLGAVLFPTTVFLHVGGEGLLGAWLRNPALAHSVAPVATLLAAGTALHGVMYVPYALQLAYGRTRLAFVSSAVFLLTLAPMMIVMTRRHGMLGGALSWVAAHVLNVAFGTWLTHRRLLEGMGRSWLLREVGIPLTISLALGVAGREALRAAAWPPLATVAAAAGLAALACGLTFAASPGLLGTVLERFGRSTPSRPGTAPL